MINENTNLLIISPHPDDETLGCGGLIQKVKKAGGKVHILIMTYGDEPQYGGFSESATRESELEAVMKFFKIDGYEVLFPGDKYHLRLDTISEKEILDALEKKSKYSLNTLKPNMVAIPAPNSYNVDHRVTYQCCFTALRPRPHHLKGFSPIVIEYDNPSFTWNNQSFDANFFLDIEDELENKLHGLSLYASQMRQDPHERSVENIRNIHYIQGRSQGVKAVENFRIIRYFGS
ncbi:PIG-L family deacetylase [bacterium]|nr:PIG-L family deacetylase [bacterium]